MKNNNMECSKIVKEFERDYQLMLLQVKNEVKKYKELEHQI